MECRWARLRKWEELGYYSRQSRLGEYDNAGLKGARAASFDRETSDFQIDAKVGSILVLEAPLPSRALRPSRVAGAPPGEPPPGAPRSLYPFSALYRIGRSATPTTLLSLCPSLAPSLPRRSSLRTRLFSPSFWFFFAVLQRRQQQLLCERNSRTWQ